MADRDSTQTPPLDSNDVDPLRNLMASSSEPYHWVPIPPVSVSSPAATPHYGEGQLPSIGGVGNSNTVGFYQSAETNIYYQFIADVANADIDLETNIADPNAPDHFIFAHRSEHVYWDSLVAHFYLADDDEGQRVMIGRRRYLLKTGSTLAQAQTRPDGLVVGETIEGWEYLGLY